MDELERRYPGIPWREPIEVVRTDGERGWACRLCVAKLGLKASEIPTLADDPAIVRLHLELEHF